MGKIERVDTPVCFKLKRSSIDLNPTNFKKEKASLIMQNNDPAEPFIRIVGKTALIVESGQPGLTVEDQAEGCV